MKVLQHKFIKIHNVLELFYLIKLKKTWSLEFENLWLAYNIIKRYYFE
jgi:hypothetical protein